MSGKLSRADVATVLSGIIDPDRLKDGDSNSDSSNQTAIFEELENIAEIVAGLRNELLGENGEKPDLSCAVDELDMVKESTESATNNILDAAEIINDVRSELKSAHSMRLEQAVNQIFEACNFQDITGQRISKVLGAIKQIEGRIEGLLNDSGHDLKQAGTYIKAKNSNKVELYAVESGGADKSGEIEEGKKLASGPALGGEGISQADIDKLLSDFD